MPTQQCNAACEHCGTFSGPRINVRLNKDLAEDAIRQAAREGYRDVVFTGGEPTLCGKWLLHAIELAKSLGLITRIVTNGWWAKTTAAAEQSIRSFIDAGLHEINFSTGDQHAKFVDVECVIRGMCAGVEAGLPVTVFVEIVKQRTITKAMLEALPCIQALRAAYSSQTICIRESPWMPLDAYDIRAYPNGVLVNRDTLARRGGCDDIIETTTIQPDGTIGACCGIGMRLIPELQLGNIADTSIAEASRKAEGDSLKRRIRSEGPERILAWAATHDREIQWENMYGHKCQACIRIYTDPKVRQVLREHPTPPPSSVEQSFGVR